MESPLTPAQSTLLDTWLPGWAVVADLSWPLQDVTVLHLRCGDAELIVKASRTSHHIAREIAAHQHLPGRLSGRVPRLVDSSVDERILLTEFLPGTLVEGTAAEADPDVYRQAGQLLDRLLVSGEVSSDYVADLVASVQAQLIKAAPLVPMSNLRRVRDEIDAIDPEPVTMAFTHGDYQPRNWLVHNGELRVIDFGRAAQRHWTSDLVRLEHQQFVGHPERKTAFYEGLDRTLDDQDHRLLRASTLQQAVGTVVWAHDIGDAAFEEHGRGMIDRALAQG